ncbi:MAG: helix-hairpin-helix domain-containing protein [Tenacibaculum sp.]|nr:helix-hairpin-helix domain-containing protein [Tenacibaculum sp.]
MENIKFRLWYNKNQRSGILFLIFLIVVFQGIYFFVDFSSNENKGIKPNELAVFQKRIDSLKKIKTKSLKTKIFPFNPNYITDFKGFQLGMSVEEINRLHKYRKQNKWINSISDFQRVTGVSDSLLNKISLYFKFPNWVKQQNKVKKLNAVNASKKEVYSQKVTTTDINKATFEDFKTIKGVGDAFSKRIINYRNRLQGFTYDYQLYEIWNIDKTVVKKILEKFKIVEKPTIKKINVNTAAFKEVLKNPYIDYSLCKKIFNYRDEVAELQNISELKNIEGFPLDKYDRIILYLEAK